MLGIILITLLLATFAVPTRASLGDCLWSHLAAETRAALHAGYEGEGSSGLELVEVDGAQIRHVREACSSPASASSDARLRATAMVLIGEALEHSAAHHLSDTRAVSWKVLANAWAALTERDRQLLRSAYLPGGESVSPEQTSPVLDKAVKLAGWTSAVATVQPSDNLYRHYVNFFLGRAQSEAYASQI